MTTTHSSTAHAHPLALDLAGAAAALSLSPRQIDKAAKATVTVDGIPPLRSRRAGRRLLFDYDDLRDWLKSLPEG